MSGETSTHAPLLDAWVERTLNLEIGASPKDKQREILKRLEDVQFHPGFYEASAIQAYFDQKLSSIAKWQCCARLLRDDITEFRREFFQRDVSARISRFEKLHSDAEYFPVLKLQLAHLKCGLELDSQDVSVLGEHASRLAQFLIENHVAEPSQKAAKQREFLNSQTIERSDWKKYVAELNSKAPAVAALNQRWLQALSRPAKTRNKLTKTKPVETATASSLSRGGWAYALIGIFIFRALITFVRYNRDDTPSRPSYTPPVVNYTPPEFSPENIEEILNSLDDETPPPPTFSKILSSPAGETEEDLIARLSALKEYEYLRFKSYLFLVVKERGELFIVFDERRYFTEIEIAAKLSLPTKSLLYKSRKADLEEFQRVAGLIREIQNTVYVTYPGANINRYHPVPAGVVLKPMMGDQTVLFPYSESDSNLGSDWQPAYRYHFSPKGETDDE